MPGTRSPGPPWRVLSVFHVFERRILGNVSWAAVASRHVARDLGIDGAEVEADETTWPVYAGSSHTYSVKTFEPTK